MLADPEGSGLYNKVSVCACTDLDESACITVETPRLSSEPPDRSPDRREGLRYRLQIRVGRSLFALSYPTVASQATYGLATPSGPK